MINGNSQYKHENPVKYVIWIIIVALIIVAIYQLIVWIR